MRLFVALEIPAAVRENLAGLIRDLRAIAPQPKWVRAENLHITLKFIGEVADTKLEAIRQTGVKPRFYQSQILLRARSSHAGGRGDLHVAPYQAPAESGGFTFELLVFNLTPRSRGQVALRGRDPRLPPRIDLRLLTDPEDRDVVVTPRGRPAFRPRRCT